MLTAENLRGRAGKAAAFCNGYERAQHIDLE
jgi:hypothetical protein